MLPFLLVIVAAFADAHGAHVLAFDALLAAVPFVAVASLVAFGDYLEHRVDPVAGLQALLWALVLAMAVLSCAARSPAAESHTLPPLGHSALLACLGLLAIKLSVGAAPVLRRLAVPRAAKP